MQPSTTPPLLSVRDLSVVYGRGKNAFRAVSDISFTIDRGECVALIGESGSGKTTIGQAILQMHEYSGSVEIDGRTIGVRARKDVLSLTRTLQPVFQDPHAALNPRKTIFRSVIEPLVIHRVYTKTQRVEVVERALRRVGLDPEVHGGRYPHQLSGGQKQRVNIARAVVMKPKILICDEPVSALDVSMQVSIIKLMRELREEMNLSMLFISHDLSVVRLIADRVMVIFRGNLVEAGLTENVFRNPQHDYTKSLIKAVPRIDAGLERN